MFGVEVIRRRTDDVLVVGRAIWMRLLGAVLAAIASGLIVVLIPSRPNVVEVMVLSLLVLLGLHIALSHASVTFRARSHVCTVRQSVFGFLLRERDIEFSEVWIRCQLNWGKGPRWLYRVTLVPQGPAEWPIRLGYMTDRTRCEALKNTIVRFTETIAGSQGPDVGRGSATTPDEAEGTS